jgi:hypothetical protein
MSKLSKDEQLVAEAIDSMLSHDAQLGLKIHNQSSEELGKAERGYEYLHGQINEMFALKAAELTHADGVCQAFSKVHNYKYLDDPSFKTAMEKEMVAQAIPAEDRGQAAKFLTDIIEELKNDQAEWAEKDFGFNPKLDDILETSQPEQPTECEILDVEDWPTEANVEFESGDASPGHIE